VVLITSIEEKRLRDIEEFKRSCKGIGGKVKPLTVDESLLVCELDEELKIYFSMHRDVLYGSFVVEIEGKKIGVTFNQKTVDVI